MSRIGKKPIPLPTDVTLTIEGKTLLAKGSKGELSQKLPPLTSAVLENGVLTIERRDDTTTARAMHGLARSLAANLIDGVSKGFSKTLELSGIGFRAALSGNKLILNVGYSHPVEIEPSKGIEFRVSDNKITVSGIDKQLVGETAANVYKVRPPEPYKGKGIRFQGQVIRKKAGKAGKAGAKV